LSNDDLKIIKERILKENRIEELLDYMGCEKISYEQRGELIVCQLPSSFKSGNPRSIQVRQSEKLISNIRSRGVKGDIFTLVSYIVNGIPANETQNDLRKAKEWVIEVLGYHDILDGRYEGMKNKGKELNKWLKEIKKTRHRINWDNVKPNLPIDEKIKNQYIMFPYYPWIQEGITWDTQMEFEVGYDLATDRVVTMVRNKDGQLIGVKGRYVGENKDILDSKKYLYLQKMNKSVELFNLHRALPYIQKHKSVIVFEGYKSVMKCYDIGIYNVVSMEGDDLSPVQISLLKSLGIDVSIILAYDKDKMIIPIDEETGELLADYPPAIMEQAEKITNRNVFALIDKWGLLDEKDSPIDQGKDKFVQLFKKRSQFPIPNIFAK
jgi:DNA primase